MKYIEGLEAIRRRHAAWATAEWDQEQPYEHPETYCSADRDRAALLDLIDAAPAAEPVPPRGWWEVVDHPNLTREEFDVLREGLLKAEPDAKIVLIEGIKLRWNVAEPVPLTLDALTEHSDPRYRPLMLAVREADEAFQKAGDAGTKTWLDDYFLPELGKHGLTVAALARPEPSAQEDRG